MCEDILLIFFNLCKFNTEYLFFSLLKNVAKFYVQLACLKYALFNKNISSAKYIFLFIKFHTNIIEDHTKII